MPEERLQKVLAAAGVASRRAAEALIAEGRVRVDGRVARVGDSVDPDRAAIEVDGMPVGVGAAHVHLALHKPAGVTSTTADRHAVRTVLDLLPTALVPDGARLYPVGRLDQDSEGLILLTNDGPWAERVLHPRFGVEREYAVALRSPLDDEQRARLAAGIQLEEGSARLSGPLVAVAAADAAALGELLAPPPDPGLVWVRATLTQGWKRQIRRMFAAVGAPVIRLVRVRIGPVGIGTLRSGRTRSLSAREVAALGAGEATLAPPRRPARRTSAPRPAPAHGAPARGPRPARPPKPGRRGP